MFKKYDPRLLCSYRSYKIRDICRIYRDKKLHEQTIRSWINSGKIKAFKDGNTVLIYGAILKQFFSNNNSKHKRTLQFDQFRCGKCKSINTPLNNILTKLSIGKNGCILAFGVCSNCKHVMNRPYKKDEEQKITENFKIENNELMRIYGYSCSTSNTQSDIKEKIAITESSNADSVDQKNTSIIYTSKTQVKRKKSLSSTSNTRIPTQMRLFE